MYEVRRFGLNTTFENCTPVAVALSISPAHPVEVFDMIGIEISDIGNPLNVLQPKFQIKESAYNPVSIP
jgi:hypothetical protein